MYGGNPLIQNGAIVLRTCARADGDAARKLSFTCLKEKMPGSFNLLGASRSFEADTSFCEARCIRYASVDGASNASRHETALRMFRHHVTALEVILRDRQWKFLACYIASNLLVLPLGHRLRDSFFSRTRLFQVMGQLRLPTGVYASLDYCSLSRLIAIYYLHAFDVPDEFKAKLEDVVVEIGAHMGISTLETARAVGEAGRVIAVEPDPRNFEILQRNVRVLGYGNVVTVNVALSGARGVATLYLSGRSLGHSLVFKSGSDHSISVKVSTLDDLLEELGVRKVNLIRIDVEGAELEVLRGSIDVLTGSTGLRLIIDTHSDELCRRAKAFLDRYCSRVQVVNYESPFWPTICAVVR
jgi:FkbM family methyltransferase